MEAQQIATHDLYIVFNGLFLFDWGKSANKEVKVYVPQPGHHHKMLLAKNLDLSQTMHVPPGPLSVDGLAAGTLPKQFKVENSLAIAGSAYTVDSTKASACFTLPWPDETYTSSFLIRRANYLGKSEASATRSPTVKQGVIGADNQEHDAIAVSEVMVLLYKNTTASKLVWEGDSLEAIDLDKKSRLLGVFSVVLAEHSNHAHNDLFNQMLDPVGAAAPADYQPTTHYQQLGQKYPRPWRMDRPVGVPDLWMEALELRATARGDRELVRTVSGMGSCDNGNRCEEC